MCYICNCLAWSVDMVQRTITFCLLACLICIICIGLAACIVAGIAYGYNYMLAEFITFTRSDVTVYMRRGQINERPELADYVRRRMGDDSERMTRLYSKHLLDSYSTAVSNSSIDYQEPEPSTGEKQPLSETLLKSVDTKNYAERLTKFSKSEVTKSDATEKHETSENALNFYRFTTPPVHRISILPNPAIQTTVLQSGTSEIIMRNFPAVKDISADVTKKESDDYYYKMGRLEQDERDIIRPKMSREETGENFDDEVKKLEDTPRRYPTRSIPMRYFDGSTVDIEDENIAYRPI